MLSTVDAFAEVARQTAATGAIKQISRLVITGALRPGQRLPSERALAEKLGVSRPSLREALSALGSVGILQVRPGSGVYVSDLSVATLVTPLSFVLDLNLKAYEELLEIRRFLEPPAARLAAKNLTEAQLDALEQLLNRLAGAEDDPSTYLALDIEFHQAIHKASGNQLLATLMESLGVLERSERALTTQFSDARKAAVRGHGRILAALRARDGERAAKAMHVHLASASAFLLKNSVRPLKQERETE